MRVATTLRAIGLGVVRRMRSRWGAHATATAIAACGWGLHVTGLRAWLLASLSEVHGSYQRAIVGGGGLVFGVLAAGLIGTFQRTITVAFANELPRVSLVGACKQAFARAGAVVALATCVAAVDTMVVVVVAAAVHLLGRPADAMTATALVAAVTTGWTMVRAVLGTATVRLMWGGASLGSSVRASAASFGDRPRETAFVHAAGVPLGLVGVYVVRLIHQPIGLAVAAIFVAVTIAIGSISEAVWYESLERKPDIRAVARVFE